MSYKKQLKSYIPVLIIWILGISFGILGHEMNMHPYTFITAMFMIIVTYTLVYKKYIIVVKIKGLISKESLACGIYIISTYILIIFLNKLIVEKNNLYRDIWKEMIVIGTIILINNISRKKYKSYMED